MDRRKLMLLLGALAVAFGAALAAQSMFAGAATPQALAAPAAPQGPRVLVARRALPVGTLITADAVSFQRWPQELVRDAYFVDGEADISRLLGTVVRNPVTAGEPVTQGSLVAPGDRGFLAAALGPGMRAATIPVSDRTGVGGFIFPGDRVDLMLTQTVPDREGGAPLNTTETIMRNLRVLATDQSTETTTSEDGKTIVRAFSTVTLEMTPKSAEKIAVAQTIGTIGLSLRSIADNQRELEQAIAASEIDLPDHVPPDEEERLLRQAANRPRAEALSYVTGGDVSRFQRSSMPAQSPRETAPGYVQPASTVAFRPETQSTGPTVRVTRGGMTTLVPVGQ